MLLNARHRFRNAALPTLNRYCPDDRVDAAVAIFKAAVRIEPRLSDIVAWYRDTPIRELDGLTAEALVNAGRTIEVLAFLREIEDERRD